MDIQAAANNTAQNAKLKDSADRLNQNFDTFLTLLTTQLKNQDPLNPMDSNEFTNQLVNFSGVEQQIRANQTLDNLLTLNKMNMTSLGLGFIGLNVNTTGDTMEFDGTNTLPFSYTLEKEAKAAQINIIDSDGATVFTARAEITAGKHNFTWDGKDTNGATLPAGIYKVRIGATDELQKPVNSTTIVPGHVSGIESGDDGSIMLIINGAKIPLTDVKSARESGA